MNLFRYSDYRELLKVWLQEKKLSDDGWSFARLADQTGMHRSGFSKVMNGDAEFSSDQVYLLARAMELNTEESSYLKLLVEQSSTGLKARKEMLEVEIRKVQTANVSTPKELSLKAPTFRTQALEAEYFASPWPSLVHVFLTVPYYQADSERIAEHLGIAREELAKVLKLLEALGLVRGREDGVWLATENGVHTELTALSSAHQMLIRSLSLHRMALVPATSRYGLTATVSMDEPTYELVRQKLVSVMKEIHALVTKAPEKKVYQLNVDVFPWCE